MTRLISAFIFTILSFSINTAYSEKITIIEVKTTSFDNCDKDINCGIFGISWSEAYKYLNKQA